MTLGLERPLIIGVVGGSGSGKATVTRASYDMEGVDASLIDQDAYYRDLSHLPLEDRKRVNFDHPDSFDTELLVAQLGRFCSLPTPGSGRCSTSRSMWEVGDDIRFIRRLRRDVAERGRSMDDVIRQYLATVRPMHLEFVEPSKRYADIIIRDGPTRRAPRRPPALPSPLGDPPQRRLDAQAGGVGRATRGTRAIAWDGAFSAAARSSSRARDATVE